MDSLQQLDVCHSAETEMKEEKRCARIHEKSCSCRSGQEGSGGNCGPETDPESP